MMSCAKVFMLFLVIAGCIQQLPANAPEEERFLPRLLTLTNDLLHDANDRFEELSELITETVLEDTFTNCVQLLKKRNDLERKLAAKGRVVKSSDRKTDISLIRMRKSDPQVHIRENSSLTFEEATNSLINQFELTREDVVQHLPRIPLNSEMSRSAEEDCISIVATDDCDANSRYRTATGACNNFNNPSWGMAMTCQQRILPANYVGNSGYRLSVNGDPLPLPRTLSLNLHYHLNRPTNYVTHMYMFFGQLLDHDLTLTPTSTTVDNDAIQCCPPENETHPQCAPILIAENDPFYSQFGTTCLNFVRSAICPTCTMGQRQQMNLLTSFIDASFVYGNSDNETSGLRTDDGTGRLRVQQSNSGDLLPRSPDPVNDQCSFPETNEICFEAGDPRVNQHTILASLHTIFLREHNRIVSLLRQINPQWSAETLFQEARRIVGAEMQVITYKEYLPITLGNDRMSYFRLWLSGRGTTVYNPRQNPTIINEFASAAFRFGHSLINSVITQRPLNATNEQRLLRNEFFQPFDLYNGFVGPLLQGVSASPAQWFDRHLVPDVTNFLFRIRGDPAGLDLASFNINRGRDNGVPTYVDMVRYCSEGEIVVQDFSDLVNHRLMEYDQAEALRENYRFVEDVDLWPGILMEIPNEGAVVGPTAACIIGMQFNKLKYGDRFYLEHRDQAGSFTFQQRQELKRTSLSTIICQNTDVRQITSNAMLFRNRNNPVISCSDVRGINLSYWRE